MKNRKQFVIAKVLKSEANDKHKFNIAMSFAKSGSITRSDKRRKVINSYYFTTAIIHKFMKNAQVLGVGPYETQKLLENALQTWLITLSSSTRSEKPVYKTSFIAGK